MKNPVVGSPQEFFSENEWAAALMQERERERESALQRMNCCIDERERERERVSTPQRESPNTLNTVLLFFLVVLRLTTYLDDDNWGHPGTPGRFISWLVLL
jgi:hypothetical protein